MHTLYLVTGASGSGKSSLMRSIMDNELISFTTRQPRIEDGEVHGKDYIFITKEEFNELIKTGGLAEQTEYSGNYYGLTKDQIDSKLSVGDAFFVCNYHGAEQLKQIYPHYVSIFIMADKEDVKQNMISRGDSMENIQKRLLTYEQEIENAKHYDFVIVNKRGEFEQSRRKIINIMKYLNA